jgi:hypothetical protein
MSQLKDLIEKELTGKRFAQVDVDRLYEAAKGSTCTPLAEKIGVFDVWTNYEKQDIRKIIASGERENQLWRHAFGSPRLGYGNHSAAYRFIETLELGDVARIKVEKETYIVAAFPSGVLFVK